MPNFEFDENKSSINKEKHGIDFLEANEFDEKIDSGEDISDLLFFSKSAKPGQNQKRINVDFPVWMINLMDMEARRIGITRQSIIKVWIAQKLKETAQ